MADEKEPTRKELAEALEQAVAMLASQGRIIESLKAQVPALAAPLAPVTKVPYKGLVRAKEACFIGSLRAPGDVWHHESDCLWSDDPYEAVIANGTKDDGTPRAEPHPDTPAPVAFQLRPRTVDALSARGATPLTASQW